MVVRRRQGENTPVPEATFRDALSAARQYREVRPPKGDLPLSGSDKADIQPALYPLEMVEHALTSLRSDFHTRFSDCVSPEERLRLTAKFLELVQDARNRLFSAGVLPQEPSRPGGVLPPEVASWTDRDIVTLIEKYQVTNANFALILQWITIHTPYKTHADIEAATGIAKSVVSRFRKGHYLHAPYEIENGAALLQWIVSILKEPVK